MHLLVLRFSAMGDVALAAPVMKSLLQKNPDLQITFVSQKHFEPFFSEIPRLRFYPIELKNKHKGINGLYRFQKKLKKEIDFDFVIDLHSVIRTRILCFFLSLSGLKYFRIDKGRKEKRRLVRRKNKQLKPLKHTTERYLDVFKSLELNLPSSNLPNITAPKSALVSLQENLNQLIDSSKDKWWIGIAPFARHREKTLPLTTIAKLIQLLNSELNTKILLFGGGKDEIQQLETLHQSYPYTINVAGKLSLSEELTLMQQLDVMISMDSSNMHMASLLGTNVVSVWGATHPFAGFGTVGKNELNVIQVSTQELPCRPCSVFGNKPCWRKDHACMERITPVEVLDKVKSVLEKV
ncbi:glycosyltransferase family 9 protein [Fulvivirgaceae bacterium BMA10]|uniref:Glycosyltransferase family 9 protein n=1 Tax=Splendidivirga corallicola TaxID=3051826 RepID=A0ABT8KIJ9_9BACT|nr:glycosyltransferase family 9 protein [Fulvivirgaceae bacterium BMA10]